MPLLIPEKLLWLKHIRPPGPAAVGTWAAILFPAFALCQAHQPPAAM